MRQSENIDKVTIIIPTCKRQDMLRRALQSAINQSYENIEIIVVDDANEKATEEYVSSLKLPNIIYKTSNSIGGAGARNVGIEIASGKYITFLDDDDIFHKEKTSKQVKSIKDNDSDIVLCASQTMYKKKIDKLPVDHNIKNQLKKGNPYHITLLCKNDILKKIKFDEELPNCQDWDLLVRLMKNNYKFNYIDDLLVTRDDGDHLRITNSVINMNENIEKRIIALTKHKDWLGYNYYSFRAAKEELSYIMKRKKKINILVNTYQRYGITPIIFLLLAKLKII
ncbi:MAG: glycosyltransferase family 2 protein [Methylicorpusculum sp.]|uniref:glycosyltransferase family 2 protein n=1 Tax=Methylicorpusculum sp. TaxID=2713644 RepID=UPI00272F41A1|nr:glycosyltransferase family 2 protein [Methylicorpusculum sp.]MDP2180852.1 glycosyltransferase family 2 protein [Methylicorpusculum sp.]